MKHFVVALAILLLSNIARAESYRVYNGVGLGQSLEQLTTAAGAAEMVIEKVDCGPIGLCGEYAIGLGLDP